MGAKCCKCCKKVEDEEKPVYIKRGDRKCTDCFFCLLFLVFWVGMIAIAGVGLSGGEPDRLLYGVDYDGKVCGGTDRADTKFVYYPQITTDLLNFARSGETNPLNVDLYGLCLSKCPSLGDVVCNAEGTPALAAIKTAHGLTDGEVMSATTSAINFLTYGSDLLTVKQNCWTVPLDTTDYFFRCLWVRNSTTTRTVVCMEPESVAGIEITDSTPSNVTDACVRRVVTETTQTWGAGQESDPLMEQLFDATAQVMRYVSDTQKAMAVILVCGGVLAVIMGFVWLLFVQRCTGCLVWTTILSVVVVLIAGTVYAYDQAGLLDVAITAATDSFNDAAGTSVSIVEPEEVSTTSSDIQTRWQYFAYLATAVTVIVILLILFMLKRIRLAIAIIKEAARSVKSMPTIMLFPLASVILMFCLIVYWLVIASYVYSNGDIATSPTWMNATAVANEVAQDATSSLANLLCSKNATTGEVDTSTCVAMSAASVFDNATANSYLLVYHFFGLLWTTNFITGFFTMCIAGAVVIKYFSADKANAVKGSFPLESFLTVVWKHMGTVAFGSLIIAIIQMVRAILAYLDRKSKDMQKKNIVIKYIFKCLACCLWCFERCVKYVSTNAYILTAMRGQSFCASAVEAVALIIKNIARVGTINTITVFLFVIGKILITAVCAVIAFLWVSQASDFQSGDNELYSYWAPLILVLIMSYAIGASFMDVLGVAIDTILLCVCVDTGRSGAGTQAKPYFASKGLLKALGLAEAVSYGTGFRRTSDGGQPKSTQLVEVAGVESKPDANVKII